MHFQDFLQLDREILISATQIIPQKYSVLVTILAESIVIWCAVFLIGNWLLGTFQKNDARKIQSLQVFGLILSVFIIYTLVNLMVPQWRQHPFDLLKNVEHITPLIPHPTDNSFPSGHALFSGAFIVAMIFYTKNRFLVFFTVLLGLTTVTCRVMGGVHYLGDILAGLTFGILGAIMFKPYSQKIIEKISPFLIKIAAFFRL